MAGLFAHATVSFIRKQWWAAVLWLTIALGVKEFAIIFPLLAVFVYSPIRWRSVAAIPILLALPFLFANYSYVTAEYRDAVGHLAACATVTENRFADIGGIVRAFHLELPAAASQLIRALAGAATLFVWWKGARRLSEPFRGLWLYALGTSYLMVFNPMTEANSYVILAPAMGCWAALALRDRTTRKTGSVVALMALSMGLLPNLLRPIFKNGFALFWHPLMAITFIVIVGVSLAPKLSDHHACPTIAE
jgi:hypothetical protein